MLFPRHGDAHRRGPRHGDAHRRGGEGRRDGRRVWQEGEEEVVEEVVEEGEGVQEEQKGMLLIGPVHRQGGTRLITKEHECRWRLHPGLFFLFLIFGETGKAVICTSW